MKSKYISYIVMIFMLFITGCTPNPGITAVTVETKPNHTPTPEEARAYCEEKGGHYETWKDEDGTSNIFCILPQGYGCDPIKFTQGSCGLY